MTNSVSLIASGLVADGEKVSDALWHGLQPVGSSRDYCCLSRDERSGCRSEGKNGPVRWRTYSVGYALDNNELRDDFSAISSHRSSAEKQLGWGPRRHHSDSFMRYSPILLVHILGGTLGLVSGATAVVFRKGSRGRVLPGRVFVASMLTMGAAATCLAIIKHQNNNIGGGILTFYLVGTAWLTARRRDGESTTDLEAKPLDFRHYNEQRTHAGRQGHLPVTSVNPDRSIAPE